MNTLRETAIDYLRQHIETGWSLEKFLEGHPCDLIPAVPPTRPAVYIYVGRCMFADPFGEQKIRLKPWQMGVTYCWRDGHNEHAIFDARNLWDDILDPKPVQMPLPLFADMPLKHVV